MKKPAKRWTIDMDHEREAQHETYRMDARQRRRKICEDTPMLAEARLFQRIGDDARKYRFEIRRLPKGENNGI